MDFMSTFGFMGRKFSGNSAIQSYNFRIINLRIFSKLTLQSNQIESPRLLLCVLIFDFFNEVLKRVLTQLMASR